MEILRENVDPEGFWRRVSRRGALMLLLDYDGTLAPFREQRDEAVPFPGVTERLEALKRTPGCRPVLVSGRAIEHLLPLLGMEEPPEIWGSHGFERRLASGERSDFVVEPRSLEALEEARRTASVHVSPGNIEVKPFSVALHWRGADRDRRVEVDRTVGARWNEIATAGGLWLDPFDGGMEMKIPGRTKADAVRRLREEAGDGVPLLYMGDDLTDEDAFRVLEPHELGVLVRGELRPTAASVWIRPPTELFGWLDRCRAALTGGVDAPR